MCVLLYLPAHLRPPLFLPLLVFFPFSFVINRGTGMEIKTAECKVHIYFPDARRSNIGVRNPRLVSQSSMRRPECSFAFPSVCVCVCVCVCLRVSVIFIHLPIIHIFIYVSSFLSIYIVITTRLHRQLFFCVFDHDWLMYAFVLLYIKGNQTEHMTT